MPLAIRDVQYFLAVAQAGLLSSAAEECGVTQPTLTKAVQRVEAEFGVPLFERTARGMALTSSGLRVMEQAQRLYAGYADTMLLASEMRAQHAGLLRIGVTDTTGENMMVPTLARLIEQRPGMRVRMRYGRSDALASQVRDGDLDVALVPVYEGQPLEGERTMIGNDPMQIVVRAAHPLAGKSRPTLEDLVPYGWIMGSSTSAAYRAVEAVFARSKLPTPRVIMEVPYVSALTLGVLARTDLVTMVPASFLRHEATGNFAVLYIPQLQLARAVVLITREGCSWSPLMTALRDMLMRGRRPVTS